MNRPVDEFANLSNEENRADAPGAESTLRSLRIGAIVAPLLIFATLAFGGRVFLLPWGLAYALVLVAMFARDRRSNLRAAFDSTSSLPAGWVEGAFFGTFWLAIVALSSVAADFAPEGWRRPAVGAAALSSAIGLRRAQRWFDDDTGATGFAARFATAARRRNARRRPFFSDPE